MSATAPTQPIPPRPFEPSADASGTAPPAGHRRSPPPQSLRPPPASALVPPRVGARSSAPLLLALLCFGGGFVAGSAASLFDGLLGGPGRATFDGGPGFPDGVPPGDGRFPGSPDDTTSSQG